MRRLALAALALSAALVATPAEARGAPGYGTDMLSLWAVFDPGPVDGIGVGGRFLFPLTPGIIQHNVVRDEFALEVGGDFIHYNDRLYGPAGRITYDWNGFLLAAGGMWNFWIGPRFAIYPKIEVGYAAGWYHGWYADRYGAYDRHDFDGVFVQGAIGGIIRLQRAALRLEAGSGLLRVGVGFAF